MKNQESPEMRHYLTAGMLALSGFVLSFAPFVLFVPFSPMMAAVALALWAICEMPAINYMFEKGMLD